MVGVSYDAFAGLSRLIGVEDQIDMRHARILAYHAAVEVELGHVLDKALPRANYVSDFSFAQKISLLSAVWRGEEENLQRIRAVLVPLNALRNAVAHGKAQDKVDAALHALLTAYRRMVPDASQDLHIDEVALGIATYLGDAPSPKEFSKILDSFDNLMNVTLPRAFGVDEAG